PGAESRRGHQQLQQLEHLREEERQMTLTVATDRPDSIDQRTERLRHQLCGRRPAVRTGHPQLDWLAGTYKKKKPDHAKTSPPSDRCGRPVRISTHVTPVVAGRRT